MAKKTKRRPAGANASRKPTAAVQKEVDPLLAVIDKAMGLRETRAGDEPPQGPDIIARGLEAWPGPTPAERHAVSMACRQAGTRGFIDAVVEAINHQTDAMARLSKAGSLSPRDVLLLAEMGKRSFALGYLRAAERMQSARKRGSPIGATALKESTMRDYAKIAAYHAGTTGSEGQRDEATAKHFRIAARTVRRAIRAAGK